MINNITLQDLLKEWGLKVNDIKSRLSSGTIEVNGVIIDDIKFNLEEISEARSAGSFLPIFMESGLLEKYKDSISFFRLCNLMSGESNIENELTEFLKDWKMVTITSQNSIFVKIGTPSNKGILFDIEGNKPTFIKIDTNNVRTEIDVEKLKRDLDKVKKQLGNPGFVNNAPEFKVKEAQAKQKRLEDKLASL